ncbi:MAG: DUF362 domain-containing protein [Candidatus Pacearchaeota archaeon]|nr:DUF362 domain-containing protein [Candidatus Pacearchaeota archaeon]
MKKRVEKVAIVKCKNYNEIEVEKAISKALSLAEIEIPKRKKVLIKPNVVGFFDKNQEAITTHPSIIEAICKILKKNKNEIFIGDSSFTNPEIAFKKSGIEEVAKKYGKLIIFEQDKIIKVKDKDAKVLKRFHLPKIIKQADLIINVPKLKTHQLTKYTGAIKNLYGCIPGGMKQKLHMEAGNAKKFSKLLVDIYQNIRPKVNIMDGVVGMEGKGPTSGKPKKAGYILASKNTISLDVACVKLMGYKPKKILAIKEAIKRKLGNLKFDLKGMKKLPNLHFEKPFVQEKLSKKILKMFKQKPIIVDKKKCIKCGLCAKKCPAQAIRLNPYPEIDKKKCIRCFCCMEVCPQHALSLKE